MLKVVKIFKNQDFWLATLGIGLGIGLLYLNGGWTVFHSPYPMSFMEYYLTNDIGLFLIPVIVITLLGRNLADFGVRACGRKHAFFAVLVGGLFFPVVLMTAKAPEFQSYYLQAMRQSGAVADSPIAINVFGLIKHLLILASYMFAWEWFFRGFLLMAIKRVSGSVVAVIAQAVLFTIMHFGKPTIEVVSSFFGAVLLGIWALRSRSVIPCFIVHALLTTLNDVAVLIHAP
jgi:membrane protease YdiL (CAAX protease family)